MRLKKHECLDTSDVETARRVIMSEFGAVRFAVAGDDAGFSVNSSCIRLSNVAVLRCASKSAIEAEFPPADFYRQYFVLRGSGHVIVEDRQRLDLSPSASVVVDPGNRVIVRASDNLEHLVLRIGQDALKRKLEALLNAHVACVPRLGKAVDPNSRLMRKMRQVVSNFVSDVEAFGPPVSAVAESEIEQSLIARFLLCHPHDYTERLLAAPPGLSSSQLRLVEEYIEANWNQPLDIEKLARIANLSVRSFFRHFRNSRNSSPLEFVNGVRLRHARSMLHSDDEQLSVMRVAIACGFQSLGHFAKGYRAAFGELPSATLRRVRYGRKAG